MKKLFTLTLTSALLFFLLLVKAQQIQKGNPGMWPAIIKYDQEAPAFNKSNIAITDAAGKPAIISGSIIKNISKDANGTGHYRYQQTVHGIAIEHADMLVHVADGKISSQNGKWIKDFPAELLKKPFLTAVSFKTYCNSTGNNGQEWIDYFRFGAMSRTSGADAGGNFNAASTYSSLNVTIGTTGIACTISAGYSGVTRNQFYAVFIHFNRNGVFTDAGEKVAGQSAITNGGNYNFIINIPATAAPGVTAVRVVMLRQSITVSSCLTGNRGETEDYYINLVTPTAFTETGEPAYVQQEDEADPVVQVAPNPSSGKYNVSFNIGFNPVQYDIVTTGGQAVRRGQIVSAKFLQPDITSMPAGLYLLRLTDRSGKTELLKLVKE